MLKCVKILLLQLTLKCIAGQYDPLPPNENLLEQNLYYEALYDRLKKDSFGFAKFGEPCDELSTEELENMLELAKLIIRDQEEDGTYRRTVEEHLRPKLKYLFDRFQVHCDYRKFQVCDKRSKTCACPHSSMGPGHNETCGYNIGKRCDLSQEKLISFGIPIPFAEEANITCLGKAECVSSFGAAKKLCRCPKGIYTNCKYASTDSMNSENTRSGVRQMGRGFSNITPMNGRTLWNADRDGDMLIFPSDIKADLVELMRIRHLFGNDSERIKEAASLYFKMESDPDKEDMVMNDMKIRKLAILKYGDPCDPTKQVFLDNPPRVSEELSWVDPKPSEILNWQMSLLDGEPMCSYIDYLSCDSATRKCVCKDTLENYGTVGCRLKVGSACSRDYASAYEFDPLKDVKRFTEPYPPDCVPGSVCKLKSLVFTKQCWCHPNNTDCDNSLENRRNKIVEIFDGPVGRFTLQLGDECDPALHEEMFNPQEPARSKLEERLRQLERFANKTNLRFCNFADFLMCNETTKKCECFNDLLQQGNTCKIKNMDNCGAAYSTGKDFYPTRDKQAGMKMWLVEMAMYGEKFNPLCVRNATCSKENLKCECTNGLAGPSCEDPRSVFAQVLSPFKVQDYNEDRDINPVLHEINFYTAQLEFMMSLTHGDVCSSDHNERLGLIIDFFRVIGNSNPNISGSKTLHQYDKARLWVKELALAAGTEGINFCIAYQGLICHESGVCACMPGTVREEGVCRLNPGEECDEQPFVGWMHDCRTRSACTSVGATAVCKCSKGWSGDSCSEKKELTPEEELDLEIAENGINNPNITTSTTTEDTIIFFQEINEMIGEIVDKRGKGLDEKCDMAKESVISKYFPTLPRWSPEMFERLPHKAKQSYYKLREVYNSEDSFCSRKDHLTCVNGVCNCGSQYGLVREGGNCRLKEFSYCGEINTIYDRSRPLPLCMSGTKCTKLDYGKYKCIKNPSSSEMNFFI